MDPRILIVITLMLLILHLYYLLTSFLYPEGLVEIKILKLKDIAVKVFYAFLIISDLLVIGVLSCYTRQNRSIHDAGSIIIAIASLYTLNLPVLAYLVYRKYSKKYGSAK